MQLHYEKTASTGSVPVVLLGSIASTLEMWRPQIEALSAAGREVIALDHRGHGHSPDPDVAPGATSMGDLTADVVETLDALGVGEFDVCGLSLGGAVAQYLTARSGRVRRAAFLCTAAYFGGPDKWAPRAELTRAEGIAPMLDVVWPLWITPAFGGAHPGRIEELKAMIRTTRGVGYASCADALAGWDFRESLGEFAVPFLTLAGRDDESTPPETVHAIGAGAPDLHTQVTVPGAHVPTVESPGEVNEALVEHFSL